MRSFILDPFMRGMPLFVTCPRQRSGSAYAATAIVAPLIWLLLMLESAICLQVHHDGRAKPLTVGVSVHKDANLSELLEAVKQHPAAACSPEEELVVGYCTGEAPNPLHTTTLLDASQETNEKHAKRGCALV